MCANYSVRICVCSILSLIILDPLPSTSLHLSPSLYTLTSPVTHHPHSTPSLHLSPITLILHPHFTCHPSPSLYTLTSLVTLTLHPHFTCHPSHSAHPHPSPLSRVQGCDYRAISVPAMKYHYERCGRDAHIFVCSKCDKEYTTQPGLKYHMKKAHDIGTPPKPSQEKTTPVPSTSTRKAAEK